jgi:hypothetical protein
MNVFITGPARGIGAAVARALAARGARLALVGMERDRLDALARELGPQHLAIECDVTEQAAVERAVALTVTAFGGIDVVIANAGIASNGTVAVTPMDALARVVDVNLTGVIRTVHTTLPHVVARRGYFLLISSAAAIAAAPGLATYSATKAGVELRHKGVGVGIAHPSWIDTDMVRDARRDLPSFDSTIAKLPGPFGVVTTLDECVAALVRAVEKRERKIYIPKRLGFYAVIRQLFMSKLAERKMAKDANVEAREAEVRKLGRSFGENSVEVTRRLR